jgi:hypothetical protein
MGRFLGNPIYRKRGGVLIRGNLQNDQISLFNINSFFERRKEMKKVMVVLMAVAALTCFLAIPAFSADKLIVKNSGGTSDVFKVTDTGQIVLPAASGVNRDAGIQNPATLDNFGLIGFYPQSGTNVGSALQIIPKGTGYNASIKAQLSVFNTDYVADPTNNEVLVLRGAGAAGFTFNSLAAGTGTLRPIVFQMNAVTKMTLGTNGNLTMAGGAYTDGTNWYPASSREYKDNIRQLSSETAFDTLKGLDPVTFTYKTVPDQGHIGFIAEDVPNAVAVNGRKAIDPVNIIAVLTKVVQEQNKTITELSEKLNKLDAQVTRLKSKDTVGSLIR